MAILVTNPPPRLTLRVLGGFNLERDTQPCDLAYEKGRALLGYLAAEPARAHSRRTLATMLWPDLERKAALTNLRQVLQNLRQAINIEGRVDHPLQVSRESIWLCPSADLEIDLAEFSAPSSVCPATLCPADCSPCLAQMEALAGRYQGEFMAGFSLVESPEYEEWLRVHREALHLRILMLLARLSECQENFGAYGKSLSFAQRFLGLDPWNEDGLRRVMRLFALNGQRASAIRAYTTCCQELKNELGILPAEETRALLERIRRDELSPTVQLAARVLPAVLSLQVTQRRQVTVLYCDLVSIGVDDLDDALALLHGPQARCSEIIRSYSGFLMQIRGGSLLAYFGYPQASENAAQLAVRAALEMTRTAFVGIKLCAGVHTGVVISSDQQVPDAIGATSELAIRLRQIVEPGEVAISAATQRLVAGYFECAKLGLKQLRGIERPLEVFRVDRESGAQDRLEAAAVLSPLVGRKNEMASLLVSWQDACAGQRRMVMLRGEAGIGKSRLVLTLKAVLREQASMVRELRCFPEHSQSPFYALRALFEFTLLFSSNDTPATKFDKLADYVENNYEMAGQDAVPLLAAMLSLPLRAAYREPISSPQQQREMTMAIILGRLYALAAQQPLLLVVEDLHWADPSTLEFLALFVAQERMLPMLAVFTARPGFETPWQQSLTPTLTLNALDNAETAMLIASVAPEITPENTCRIVDRADGIPLFAEELARELDGKVADHSAIPSTLQDLLATRLDGMGAAKIAAQSAATLGRKFDVDLLRQIAPFDDATLGQLLRELQDTGILCSESKGVFSFKHALIRDAAYQSQTRAEREAVHRLSAIALKKRGGQAQPELLAQHWAAGGEIRQALNCWIAAGKLSNQRAASQEAVTHFKSGMLLIDALPDSQERWQSELDLHISLGAAACSAQGYASLEGAAAYARALVLCGQRQGGPEMFLSIWGLWASASSRTDYAGAQDIAQQLLHMAGQSNDLVFAQQGHFAVADTLYWQGGFVQAREHLEQLSALYHHAHHDRHIAEFGEDAGVTGGSYSSWTLWFLGFPDQARKASMQAVALARQHGHPYSLAYALTFASILHCRQREPEEALVLATETLSLATKHGFPLWKIGAELSRGWALAMHNQRNGVDSLLQCVEAVRTAMGGVTLTVLGPLVDAYAALGHFDSALGVIDQALALGKAIGDHHIEAELHRLKGESLLGFAGTDEDAAEASFHQALLVSRQQQAKSLELRAATSLGRLWQRQGKTGDARQILDEVYSWFDEGFGTPDLLDAKELLDSLSATAARSSFSP